MHLPVRGPERSADQQPRAGERRQARPSPGGVVAFWAPNMPVILPLTSSRTKTIASAMEWDTQEPWSKQIPHWIFVEGLLAVRGCP